MAQQIAAGETFTNVAPGKTVTDVRLNNHVNGASVLVGAISSQTEMTDPVADGDMLILQDASDVSAGAPKKVQAQNLLPESVRNGSKGYAGGTQSGGVYAVTLAPAATAYTEGMVVRFKADSANTGAVSVNVNGLGNKNIFTRAAAALAANDILANQIVELVYDGTRFLMLNALSAQQVTATHLTEAARGSVQQYAADSGSANTYAITLAPAPAGYTTGMTVKFKAANANTSDSTLNVNALGAKTLKKNVSTALVANDILANQIVTVVYDGTNFQLVNTSRAWDFTSTNTSLPGASAAATIAHGLGALPSKLRVVLVQTNASAQQGYAQNDVVDIAGFTDHSANKPQFTVSVDATNITVAQTNVSTTDVIPKTGGAWALITAANWSIRAYASL